MSENRTEKPGYRAPAVHKAFEILRTVANSRQELSLSELSQILGYSKSSIHGLIAALADEGALDQNPQNRKFSIGSTIVELTFGSWNYLRVSEKAQPVLTELRDEIEESVFLGGMSRSRSIIMATAEATKPIKISSPPGTSIPLLAGAVGKVFLAQLPASQVRDILQQTGLPAFTEHSITDTEEYLSEVEKVRKTGYGLDNGEYLSGVRAVAVALGNHRGMPLALWVVGFSETMGQDSISAIVPAILKAADKLRHILDNGE